MADLATHWLSAPKNRAMYHLLQVSGTALEVILPARSNEIDVAKRSLKTVSADREGTVVAVDVSGEVREVFVPSETFGFYRRGDVRSLVERRPVGVDDRSANWGAAMRWWSDVLDLDPSERRRALDAEHGLAPEPEGPAVRSAAGWLPACIALTIVLMAVAWWQDWAAVLVGVGAAALVLGLGENSNPSRVGVASIVAAAAGFGGALALGTTLADARLTMMVLVGSATVAASAQLGQRDLIAGFVSIVVGGFLLGAAGTLWIIVGVALVLLNIVTTVLGADQVSPVGHTVLLAAYVIAAWAGSIVGVVAGSNESTSFLLQLVLIIIAAALVAVSLMLDAVTGTRRSLSPLFAPGVLFVAALISAGPLRISLLAAVCVALGARLLVSALWPASTRKRATSDAAPRGNEVRAQSVTIASSVRE